MLLLWLNRPKKCDMGKLNEEVFLEWLEGFGSMAFVNNAEDILNIYMESTESTATP